MRNVIDFINGEVDTLGECKATVSEEEFKTASNLLDDISKYDSEYYLLVNSEMRYELSLYLDLYKIEESKSHEDFIVEYSKFLTKNIQNKSSFSYITSEERLRSRYIPPKVGDKAHSNQLDLSKLRIDSINIIRSKYVNYSTIAIKLAAAVAYYAEEIINVYLSTDFLKEAESVPFMASLFIEDLINIVKYRDFQVGALDHMEYEYNLYNFTDSKGLESAIVNIYWFVKRFIK